MDFLAEVIDKYGGTISSTGFIGLLALYLNRRGQQEENSQQKAVNKLAEDRQNFEQLQTIADLRLKDIERFKQDAIDERNRRIDTEKRCEELQSKFIDDLERYADRIFPPEQEN